MKSLALTLALALTLPGSALANEGPKRPDRPSFRVNVPDYQLSTQVYYCPSGLTVMFQQDSSHPIVSIMSIVNHGSGDDPPGKEGTAHFAEHTWFKSVQTVEMGWDADGNPIEVTLPPIMDVLGDYGTLMNATTRNDWTDYRTVFASRDLDLFLQLESRRITDPYIGVKEEQIFTEREVVTNEWRRRNDQGPSRLFDYTYQSVYPEGHAYHAGETKESIHAIDLQTLKDYFDAYYQPHETTIAVVGDFDLRQATSLLFKNFAPEVIDPKLKPEHIFRYPAPGVANPDRTNPDHWWFGAYDPDSYDPAKPAEEQALYSGFLMPADDTGPNDQAAIDARVRVPPNVPAPTPPPRATKELVKHQAPIDHRYVIVAWSLPGGFRADDAQIRMVGPLANVAMSQWFNPNNYRMYPEEWRPSDITDSFCFVQPEKEASTVMCGVEVRNKKLNPAQIAEKIIDQMPTIWNPDLVTMFERQWFPQARQQNLSFLLKSVDNVAYHFGGRAEDIVTYAHFTGKPGFHSHAMNQALSIDAFEVARLASKFLTRDRAVSLVIDPLPSSEIDKTGEGSQYAGVSETDQLATGGDWVKALSRDDIAAAYVAPDIADVIDETLPNGLRVIVLPHGEAPVAYTELVLGGGTSTGPKGAISTAYDFTSSISLSGPNDPLAIAGEFSGNLQSDHSYLALRHAAGNVDEAMWLLREFVENIKPSTAYKKTYIQGLKTRMSSSWVGRNPGWLVRERTMKHSYPDTPNRWGRTWEDIEAIGSWGPSQVNAVVADVYQPANATLIVTGKIDDPKKTFERAKAHFGGWKAKPTATSDVASVATASTAAMSDGAKILIFDDPKRTQTQISGQCRLNYDGPDDDASVSVLSSLVFDEIFTTLRVKEGLAYSPGGFAYTTAGNMAMLQYSSLAVNDGVGRTLEVMNALVQRAEDGGLDPNVIKLHQIREARSRGIEAQSTLQMGDRLRGVAVDKVGVDHLVKYGEQVADVKAEQLQALTQGCGERLIYTLHGPTEVITPQLDKYGYEYEVVDWKAEGEARFQAADPKGFKKYAKQKAKNAAKEAAEDEDDGSAAP